MEDTEIPSTMNTSIRTQPTIFPELRYRDPDAAIAFLEAAFGFTEHVVYRSDSGHVTHAELKLGPSIVMVGQDSKAAGAEIIRELEDKHYGSRDFVARDVDGNLWVFGTYDPYAVER